jgi:hypothetical protein
MSHVRAFGRLWWDFVVGDDTRLAAGVAASIASTWLLAREGIDAGGSCRSPLRCCSPSPCAALRRPPSTTPTRSRPPSDLQESLITLHETPGRPDGNVIRSGSPM